MPHLTESQLTTALRARGQRVTSQRVVIHRALQQLGHHASAEQVLDLVRDRLPGISLPTVYSTLELFEELGIARRVTGGRRLGGPILYDPRIDPHHHLVCRRCGRLEDLEAPLDDSAVLEAARRQGWVPDGSELVLTGLCPSCAR
jgi:Fur family ferric uptake transcriptional regulator/Fur family peroxide stress response transcriptional regulator